jgi:hypothetical protein
MNTSSPTRWVWRRCLGPPAEASPAESAESPQTASNRWHEESKQRYEELTHQLLELAEQRQRCA